jgi:hypothetical protein
MLIKANIEKGCLNIELQQTCLEVKGCLEEHRMTELISTRH